MDPGEKVWRMENGVEFCKRLMYGDIIGDTLTGAG
jgi:hypothetical protein